MADILLINPPIYYHRQEPVSLDVSYPPLGLLYLASTLEKHKLKVGVIDIAAEKQTLTQTVSQIRKNNPGFIGLSAMTPTLQGTVTLAKNIKKYFPKIKICLGGPHLSADPNFINRHPYFDYGIIGEAEITLSKLLTEARPQTKILHGLPESNLTHLPWPARHLINSSNYLARASLIATRGCPFHCYYCSRPAVSNLVRCRSPKDVVEEMQSLYQSCRGDYLFQDDSFTINRQNTEDFCLEIIRHNLHLRWAAYTRIDLVDEKLLHLMSLSGCYSLTFGIETGDESLRKEVIGKNFSNAQVLKTIKLCRKYHINPDGFFMLGHPTETPHQVKKTINFILKNDFNIVGVSIATPFPGSKLWNYAVKDKLINLDFIDRFAEGKTKEGYASVYPVYCPPTLHLDWLYQQRQYIMRRFYLHPRRILSRLLQDLISLSDLKTDLKEGFNVVLKGSSSRSPYQKKTT